MDEHGRTSDLGGVKVFVDMDVERKPWVDRSTNEAKVIF